MLRGFTKAAAFAFSLWEKVRMRAIINDNSLHDAIPMNGLATMSFSQISNRSIAIALTLLAILGTSYLLANRYVYLNVKRNVHSFFERSLTHIHTISVFQIRQGATQSQDEIKKHNEIIRWHIRPAYGFNSELNMYSIRHLFNHFGQRKETLQGYGQVAHAHVSARPNISGATRAWFVLSDGPSGASVKIDETQEPDGVHKYVINSIPYHLTNGIRSVGYLYQDTNGMRVGDTPLVGTTK